MDRLCVAVMLGMLVAAQYSPTIPHETLPGVRVTPRGFVLGDPHPELKRACAIKTILPPRSFAKPDGFCHPAMIAAMCTDSSGRQTADLHWWVKDADGRCVYEVETYTREQLERGVMTHGAKFRWRTKKKKKGSPPTKRDI